MNNFDTDKEQLQSLSNQLNKIVTNKEQEVAAVWVDVNDLTPWDENPRINDHAVDEVMQSIKRFGFASPIIARKEDGVIIAGHTRMRAAKQLGLKKVPVRFMDLDPADARILAIADNKLGEIADWDEEALSKILSDMDDVDLEFTGFTEEELDQYIDSSIDAIDEDEDIDDDENDDHLDEFNEEYDGPFEIGHTEMVGDHLIICGDCVEVMKTFDDNSIDAIVCDPPYGIDFMSKKWDADVPQSDWAKEVYRVLKHGGHIIAFSATRTVHRLGTILEDAGFEIRDMINWVYASGFPKNMNIGLEMDKLMGTVDDRKVIGKQRLTGTAKPANGKKGHSAALVTSALDEYDRPDEPVIIDKTAPASPEAKKWDGWGTGLKPACEPAVLARKPLSEKTVAKNILKWGTGAINVERCRLPYGDDSWFGPSNDPYSYPNGCKGGSGTVLGLSDGAWRHEPMHASAEGRFPANVYQCKKAQRKERDEGLDHMTKKTGAEAVHRKDGSAGLKSPRAGAGRTRPLVANFHPTVKPVKLMKWLVRLVTPEGGTVLDTFGGSGTTLVAAEIEGIKSIGIELEPDYCNIIYERLKHVCNDNEEEE